MAQQLLSPSYLDTLLRSRLFLSGPRRVGKTTFLARDLIPALENRGAIVIYVDLWSQPQTNTSYLVHDSIKKSLSELQTPGSGILQRLKRVSSLSLGGAGLKFSFQLADVGKDGGVSLAQAFTELVDQAKTDVVLISGDVQGVINLMTSANLLMRVGHGVYGVTDSFVEQAWVTRLQADDILRTDTT